MILDDSLEDVEEELNCLQPGLPQEDIEEAADLARALFSVGASPVEAKAVLMEIFSPPRVTAQASKYPRFGLIPGGAFDLRPGPMAGHGTSAALRTVRRPSGASTRANRTY